MRVRRELPKQISGLGTAQSLEVYSTADGYAGARYPANVVGVKALLTGLKRRGRMPEQKRY